MDGGLYEIERKFLIRYPDVAWLRSNAQGTEIEQTYLINPQGCTDRVRRRGDGANWTYTHTVKTRISDMRRIEIENEISPEEYERLLSRADPERRTIRKRRWCYKYLGQLFEIDIFPFWSRQAYMEIELEDEGQSVNFPPEIEIIREVTGDRRYTNAAMAKCVPEEDGE